MTGKNSRMPLKSKFVEIYERLLNNGEEPWLYNANFWHEVFLLKVNEKFLRDEIESMKLEKLFQLKQLLNLIVSESVLAIESENELQVIHGYQTLGVLISSVQKIRRTLDIESEEILDISSGVDNYTVSLRDVLQISAKYLDSHESDEVKLIILKVLLVIVTASDNISNNVLIGFLMMRSLFDSSVKIISEKKSKAENKYLCLLLLTFVLNYRKYESTNLFIVNFVSEFNESALRGIIRVLGSILDEFLENVSSDSEVLLPDSGSSLFSGFTSMVGKMFLQTDISLSNCDMLQRKKMIPEEKCIAVVLAMYEFIRLDRHFFSLVSQQTTGTGCEQDENSMNLFSKFIEFTSIIMQTKDASSTTLTKLCLVILTCIVEEEHSNAIIHDEKKLCKVKIHYTPMRHRKLSIEKNKTERLLAVATMDLMVEYIQSNMKSSMSLEMHMRCLGVVLRMLCYQKKYRVRLEYPWKELWSALINLLRYSLSNEERLLKSQNIFVFGSLIVNIFNLFITYGDTFLPTLCTYDELYYELIRCNQVFDNLYSTALRHTANDNRLGWRESAARLASDLFNIRAIINHFLPKITLWASSNDFSSLTEGQVLKVVRENYESLTLKLHENLDQYERYSENPRETPFFTAVVKYLIVEVRSNLQLVKDDRKEVT